MYHGHVYLHRICYQIVAKRQLEAPDHRKKRSVNYIHLSFGICKNRVATEIWDSKNSINNTTTYWMSMWYFSHEKIAWYQLDTSDNLVNTSWLQVIKFWNRRQSHVKKPSGSFKVIDLDQQVSGSNTPWEESLIDVQQVDDILLFFYHKILKRW